MLIINSDDWGRNAVSTNNALRCFLSGGITSASAMIFMEDSERAAAVALETGLAVGLHLNFTEAFNGRNVPSRLRDCQGRIASFLLRSKYSLLLYNPLLRSDFEYAFKAQHDHFLRLYEKPPTHVDGHHHMHLCTNMLVDGVVPPGFKVRRSFSFAPGEKGLANRLYRYLTYKWLKRRHICTDFFFSIGPAHGPARLRSIIELSRYYDVEVMVHPERPYELAYLTSPEYMDIIKSTKTGTYSSL